MNVRLISVTEPMKSECDCNEPLTAEELIAFVARVSNPANQNNQQTAPKLLKYLINNRHWSPFELVHMTVEIKTSRAIAQQILRHRSFSFQEFSQRYAEVTDYETYPARRQDNKNRQNSIDDLPDNIREWFESAQEQMQGLGDSLYRAALEHGIAKEQARFLLPLSTSTTLYMSGSVRSWIHYLQLRCGNGTQLEHKEIADAIKAIFVERFPATSEALEWK